MRMPLEPPAPSEFGAPDSPDSPESPALFTPPVLFAPPASAPAVGIIERAPPTLNLPPGLVSSLAPALDPSPAAAALPPVGVGLLNLPPQPLAQSSAPASHP
ncbi:MAG: hypothetical protein ABW061_07485 [Polyangiaceae bacterium]